MITPPLLLDRPLVILAGWLGCQPRNLRRYESIYRQQGFQVASRIATPMMIVQTSSSTFVGTPRKERDDGSLDALVWELMDIIDQCPVFLFHGFSNGGSFVWERLRDLLEKGSNKEQKCLGVIFDSSPAYFGGEENKLNAALDYCTWQERIAVRLRTIVLAKTDATFQKRAEQFWSSMKNDPLDIRQLYLCSRNDPLTPFAELEDLIRVRQERVGMDKIWKRVWDSSPHCCHLLKHPVEYKETVKSFVHACIFDLTVKGCSSRL